MNSEKFIRYLLTFLSCTMEGQISVALQQEHCNWVSCNYFANEVFKEFTELFPFRLNEDEVLYITVQGQMQLSYLKNLKMDHYTKIGVKYPTHFI